MARERITEATQTTTEVKFRGKEDDPRSIFELIKALVGVFAGKVSLRQLFLGDADIDVKRTSVATRTIERDLDEPKPLPRENLEDELSEGIHADLAQNALEAEARLLASGKPIDSRHPGEPGKRVQIRHELAKLVEELLALGYKIELDESDNISPSDGDSQ